MAQRFDRLRLEVAPFWAPARDGKPSREDDSPFVEELNEAVENKDASRTRELFGTNQPIADSNWKFSAKNLNGGEAVPVRVGAGAANEISVRVLPGLEPNAGVMITFPPELASSVLEVTASVEMVDAFNNKGAISRKVWSHALASANKEQLADEAVSIAAGTASIEVGRLVRASKITDLPTTDLTVSQPFNRCARLVRLYAGRAAEDGHVDVGEMSRLKALADQCKNRP
jgi:hypothetical protein